jgi:hypothetical protein
MAPSIVQILPRRVGDKVEHVRWQLDLDTAASLSRWAAANPGRLEREATQMAQHFPRWLLTVVRGREPMMCPSCQGMLVFDRGLRCSSCERELARSRIPPGAQISWFGLMPPIGIDSLTKLRNQLVASAPARHVVGSSPATGHYLLVPLLAVYPEEFPQTWPRITYFKEIFSVGGMPARGSSHTCHMLPDDVMCLFAAGQWRAEMSCREVLQQRAYPHVVKLLNYADGKTNAFAIVTR